MPGFGNAEDRSLDMGVYVTRAATGKKEGICSEAQLEPFGWSRDPLAAVEGFRQSMGWPDDVEIAVKTDEESNLPTVGFRLVADIGVRTTRHQKALRLIGQYLIDMADGVESDPGFYGQGIQLVEEN